MRSRRIADHSMTNTCETEVKPCGENSRRHSIPFEPSPWMDMSIAAWPSIDPAIPRSACSRAASMSRERTNSRNKTARTTIISGPPRNSAAVNCHPISRARMMPNSTTRLVEPISNAMAAVKLAPLRNRDRANATAAYEHDDDAAPRPAATARVRGRSSPIRDTIVERRTTACTTADSAKPRISAHRISQVIEPASANAWPMAASALLITRPSASVGFAKLYPMGVSVKRAKRLISGPGAAAAIRWSASRCFQSPAVTCGTREYGRKIGPTHRPRHPSHSRNSRHTGNNRGFCRIPGGYGRVPSL